MRRIPLKRPISLFLLMWQHFSWEHSFLKRIGRTEVSDTLFFCCCLYFKSLRLINHFWNITFRVYHMRHWQLIRSKLGFYFSSGKTLDIDVFHFDALPIDPLKIKHTKKLKEIPSRHFLEKPPEKASMYAFKHLKLIGNLQGFN